MYFSFEIKLQSDRKVPVLVCDWRGGKVFCDVTSEEGTASGHVQKEVLKKETFRRFFVLVMCGHRK